MLAIDPAKVKMDRAVGAVLAETGEPGVWSLPGSLSRDPGSPDFSPSGATGAPGRATVERGRSLLAEMASELCEGLKQLYPDLA